MAAKVFFCAAALRSPSYAAQFLRVIKAVKAKSGPDQLDEANRAHELIDSGRPATQKCTTAVTINAVTAAMRPAAA